jgi:hypothetical protein
MKDPNVRPKTLKLLQENTGKPLNNTGTGNCFLNRTPIAQEIRTRTDKWDCIRSKQLLESRDNPQSERKPSPSGQWTKD